MAGSVGSWTTSPLPHAQGDKWEPRLLRNLPLLPSSISRAPPPTESFACGSFVIAVAAAGDSRPRPRCRTGSVSGVYTEWARNSPWCLRAESSTARPVGVRRRGRNAVKPPRVVVSPTVCPILGKFTSLLSALSSSTCSSVQFVYGARERPIAASPACAAVRSERAAMARRWVGDGSSDPWILTNGHD